MSKEFTVDEIDQMNEEFNTANASTKWKFMCSEAFQRCPDVVKYSIRQETMNHYFDLMTDGTHNWKDPFTAMIHESQLDACKAAATYFTGAELNELERDGPNVWVECRGYYEAIGA